MKNKKLITILLIVSCIISMLQVQIFAGEAGATFTDGDFIYKINADTTTVTLTGISVAELGTNVLVPEQASDGTSTYTVTQLGDCFKNKGTATAKMESLVLPDTITKFTGTAQFYACKALTSIHLPANLTGDKTGDGYLTKSFYFCPKLASVELPVKITKCYGTFASGSGVKTVIITGKSQVDFYSGVGSTDMRAWADGTTGITIYYPADGTAPKRTSGSFTAKVVMIGDEPEPPSTVESFEVGNFKYQIIDDVDNKVSLLSFSQTATKEGSLVIPSTVSYDNVTYTIVQIGAKAFDSAANITDVTVPDTVTYIGYQAFMGMKGLTSFEMPDSVNSIGYGTFYGCEGLVSVKLSKTLTGTLQTTFMYCKKLKSVYIPKGITTLNRTFQYCDKLETIVVSEKVNKVDSSGDLFTVSSGVRMSPLFAFYGPKNSVVADYAATKGQTYVPIDNDLCITSVTIEGNQAIVEAISDLDSKTDLKLICGFYDKKGQKMYDSAVKNVTVTPNGFNYFTVDMNGDYDMYNMSCYTYLWSDVVDNIPMSDVKIIY